MELNQSNNNLGETKIETTTTTMLRVRGTAALPQGLGSAVVLEVESLVGHPPPAQLDVQLANVVACQLWYDDLALKFRMSHGGVELLVGDRLPRESVAGAEEGGPGVVDGVEFTRSQFEALDRVDGAANHVPVFAARGRVVTNLLRNSLLGRQTVAGAVSRKFVSIIITSFMTKTYPGAGVRMSQKKSTFVYGSTAMCRFFTRGSSVKCVWATGTGCLSIMRKHDQ